MFGIAASPEHLMYVDRCAVSGLRKLYESPRALERKATGRDAHPMPTIARQCRFGRRVPDNRSSVALAHDETPAVPADLPACANNMIPHIRIYERLTGCTNGTVLRGPGQDP